MKLKIWGSILCTHWAQWPSLCQLSFGAHWGTTGALELCCHWQVQSLALDVSSLHFQTLKVDISILMVALISYLNVCNSHHTRLWWLCSWIHGHWKWRGRLFLWAHSSQVHGYSLAVISHYIVVWHLSLHSHTLKLISTFLLFSSVNCMVTWKLQSLAFGVLPLILAQSCFPFIR